MNTKILIVGSNGYVGKHLTKEFMNLGYDNLILTDIQDESFFKGVNYFQWDISTKTDALVRTIKECEFVFFFGGLTGTINSIENYSRFVTTNEIGLLNLLDILKIYNPHCKIIFPSTRLVYKGKKGIAIKEEDEKEFKTVYAMNKFSCENYLKIYQECYGIRYSIFRICVPFANTLDDKFSYGTIGQFLNKAKENKDILIFGDGSQRRTFTHITDLVNVIIRGAFNAHTDNGIFNIGGRDNLSILQVAEKIAELFSVSVEFKEWSLLDRKIESGDTVFDSSKLDSILLYNYEHSFEDWVKASRAKA